MFKTFVQNISDMAISAHENLLSWVSSPLKERWQQAFCRKTLRSLRSAAAPQIWGCKYGVPPNRFQSHFSKSRFSKLSPASVVSARSLLCSFGDEALCCVVDAGILLIAWVSFTGSSLTDTGSKGAFGKVASTRGWNRVRGAVKQDSLRDSSAADAVEPASCKTLSSSVQDNPSKWHSCCAKRTAKSCCKSYLHCRVILSGILRSWSAKARGIQGQ